MTNSPPANVNPGLRRDEPARVLASGIDTLALTFQLRWPDSTTFDRLAELKARAKEEDSGEPITLELPIDEGAALTFEVQPHGSSGYEWLLVGQEMSISLGKSLTPRQRPSAAVTIRSEALWRFGPAVAVERVQLVLESLGAEVEGIKPSRIDLCVDVLVREKDWHPGLAEHFVTRARYDALHRKSRDLAGFSIGKGTVLARIYDKPREIGEKSHKDWLWDIWKLNAVPTGHRIVRVEFQLRRDSLREGGLKEWCNVEERLPGLWAYCSRRWLRLVLDAGLHHTQQKPLPWWRTVETGFTGSQGAAPIVRERARNTDLRRLASQSVGTLGSMVALGLGPEDDAAKVSMDRRSFLHAELDRAIDLAYLDDDQFTRRVERKRAKLSRSRPPSEASRENPRDAALESPANSEEDRR